MSPIAITQIWPPNSAVSASPHVVQYRDVFGTMQTDELLNKTESAGERQADDAGSDKAQDEPVLLRLGRRAGHRPPGGGEEEAKGGGGGKGSEEEGEADKERQRRRRGVSTKQNTQQVMDALTQPVTEFEKLIFHAT